MSPHSRSAEKMVRNMWTYAFAPLAALGLLAGGTPLAAAPALQVIGKEFTFPHVIPGLPRRLSDFPGLEINSFLTNDGVKLTYWEAGKGRPLIFARAGRPMAPSTSMSCTCFQSTIG
jgi:hypothetical protein